MTINDIFHFTARLFIWFSTIFSVSFCCVPDKYGITQVIIKRKFISGVLSTAISNGKQLINHEIQRKRWMEMKYTEITF